VSNIIELYEQYLSKLNEDSVDELFDCFVNYDFSEYSSDIQKVVELRKSTKNEEFEWVQLYTNGSTSLKPRPYKFGPAFPLWVRKIESYLRGMHLGTNIFLCCRLGNGKPPSELILSPVSNNSKRHYDASGNFLDDDQLEDFFRHIREIYESKGKVVFTAFPDVWNMLFSNPLFNHLCDTNKEKIECFVNTDFEMLFKNKNFYIRDQMINWSSGLNFYTCESGTKHFLPIFYENKGCWNLINLLSEKDDSDNIKIGSKKMCECGRKLVSLDIAFHNKNAIMGLDKRLLNFNALADLKGRYANFQIHQNEDNKITIFLTPLGSENKQDLELIRSFFLGFQIKIEFNKYFEIGSKRYCYWRSEKIDPKEFKLS
jgi:hypothetical protein